MHETLLQALFTQNNELPGLDAEQESTTQS